MRLAGWAKAQRAVPTIPVYAANGGHGFRRRPSGYGGQVALPILGIKGFVIARSRRRRSNPDLILGPGLLRCARNDEDTEVALGWLLRTVIVRALTFLSSAFSRQRSNF